MWHRRKRGFSLLELIFVIAILSILILIGTLNWRTAMKNKEFKTQFDNLVQQVKEAQIMAKAHGRGISDYSDSGAFTNDEVGDYNVILTNHGANRTDKTNIYKNVTINFVNFQIKSMLETDLNDDFKGVALVFGVAGSAYNKMLPFDANGVPVTPAGQTPPSPNPIYEIEMFRKDSGGNYLNRGRIFIDGTTGAIRTEYTQK